ncbi:T9SS type A sorting domain-containing protein [Crocinitomicaceae bacterium]|nr:T9SS type A sorting domain-containing protein [Crocinitomicaceae bacterium]
MKLKLLLISSIFAISSSAVFAQYCMSGGPSSLNDSNLENLQITGASGSINYVGCPAVLGVEYYTTENVTLNAGSSYVLGAKFGTCGGNFSSVAEAWIDFDGNGIFEPSESILTWSGVPPQPLVGYSITVPANAISGATRMRVIQAESSTLPLNPCASFTWGSVTDFNVIIQGGVDCSAYIGDDQNDPRAVPSIPFVETNNSSFCYSNQNPAYASPDVFYKIIPAGIGSINVSLCGSTFDTFLSILDENGIAVVGNDDAVNCGTSSEIEFLTDGYDSLYVVVEGWGSASGDYTITITQGSLSLDDIDSDQLTIYPNPADNEIHIGNATEGVVTIFNAQGQMVLNKNLEGASSLDISELPSGFYLVQLTNKEQTREQKLIVK